MSTAERALRGAEGLYGSCIVPSFPETRNELSDLCSFAAAEREAWTRGPAGRFCVLRFLGRESHRAAFLVAVEVGQLRDNLGIGALLLVGGIT